MSWVEKGSEKYKITKAIYHVTCVRNDSSRTLSFINYFKFTDDAYNVFADPLKTVFFFRREYFDPTFVLRFDAGATAAEAL